MPQMNQTQATVGSGGSALTAALTTALTGVKDLNAAHAAAYAFVILFVRSRHPYSLSGPSLSVGSGQRTISAEAFSE
jgi:hypothetical protein